MSSDDFTTKQSKITKLLKHKLIPKEMKEATIPYTKMKAHFLY